MKHLAPAALSVAIAAALLPGWLLADQPVAQKTIRILLTTGGHAFEEEPFYAMFDQMPDVEYTKATLPDDASLLKPALAREYDCIVMYDMCREPLMPRQQKAFTMLLEKGIGVVSLHHNLGAHRDWDEFRKIIGGKFIFGDCQIDGQSYTKTPWSHGEEIEVTVADTDHPITQGVEDFDIHDETYGRFYVAPDVHVLLTTDDPKNNPTLAWTTRYGNSRVFYLMLGHDGQAYGNPSFSRLVHQGIRWAAGQ